MSTRRSWVQIPLSPCYYIYMPKEIIPSPLDEQNKNPLVKISPKARGKALATLSPKEKRSITENLVESAMIMGIHDAFQIKKWLGDMKMNTNAITSARGRIMERWKTETTDVSKYANKERARLMKTSWENVRKCEKMCEGVEDSTEWTRLKALQLNWLQFISKLSYVEKMVEAVDAPLSINLYGGKEKPSIDKSKT